MRRIYMSQYICIKKMENDMVILATLEDNEQFQMPKKILPKDSREGDVLKLNLSFDPFKTLEVQKNL